jgi:hypothetical protein
MSYAIGEIVFGLNLNDSDFDEIQGVIEYLEEGDVISSAYSGNGDAPRWLGETIGQLDECNNELVDAAFIKKLTPTPELEIAYQATLANAIQELEDFTDYDDIPEDELKLAIELFKQSKPAVWILWGSS